MITEAAMFELKGKDHKLVRGNLTTGRDRQFLFITGFLSKRWGAKSKALADWCKERGWGFCCFDFRGWGDSEGNWGEYRLVQWLEDVQAVTKMLAHGPPLTLVGNSLGGWLAWLVAQQQEAVEEVILIAPAFNMMGRRAAEVSAERRARWQAMGAMPWDDEPLHSEAPIPWHWVEDSEALWNRRAAHPRRIKTTILHGLQDRVIQPAGSWDFVREILAQDLEYPIELLLKRGDHRLSSPEHLETFRRLVCRKGGN